MSVALRCLMNVEFMRERLDRLHGFFRQPRGVDDFFHEPGLFHSAIADVPVALASPPTNASIGSLPLSVYGVKPYRPGVADGDMGYLPHREPRRIWLLSSSDESKVIYENEEALGHVRGCYRLRGALQIGGFAGMPPRLRRAGALAVSPTIAA